MKEMELLKEFIALAKEHQVSELKYEKDNIKFEVSFNKNNVANMGYMAPAMFPPAEASLVSTSQTNKADRGNFIEVKSPFVGTFYSAPAPDKPAYVKAGDKISKGQPLCILEAMKIMNEIESEVAGEVVEICVENESLVEFGQVLFKLKP
jgi:acetyl-CoA carboxylase biotin carboxyl carrier protein